MKRSVSRSALAVSAMFAAVIADAAGWKPLLEDGDLSRWDTLLASPHPSDLVPGLGRNADGSYAEPLGVGRDPVGVFTLLKEPDGFILRVSGRVFGAIITKESYADYHLRLQFKWGEERWAPRANEPRDSGILYHIARPVAEPRRSVPRSLEFRIREGGTGDMYAIGMEAEVRAGLPAEGSPTYDPAAKPVAFGPGTRRMHCKADDVSERNHGEWNDLELLCVGSDSVYVVNGRVAMRVRSPHGAAGGRIALQSEGAEIFFRDLQIRPLAEIPGHLDAVP